MLLWGFVLLPVFQFVPCHIKSVCTNGVIEDTVGVFQDYAANPLLALFSLILIIDVSILNIAGVSITKYGSSAQRTTCDMLRNLFVWFFFMLVPIRHDPNSGDAVYLEKFTFFQMIGFIILVIGVLIYNEILVIPYFGFNRFTKIAIEERDKCLSVDRKSIDYKRRNSSSDDRPLSSEDNSTNQSDRALSGMIAPSSLTITP